MRVVIQRVRRAQVSVDGRVVGKIEVGLLVYAASAAADTDADLGFIAEKIARLRIFEDDQGKLNLDVQQVGGGVLLVSALTVLADARKGRRPSLDAAAPGGVAAARVEALARLIRAQGVPLETGEFAADMQVESVNDGPICIVLESSLAAGRPPAPPSGQTASSADVPSDNRRGAGPPAY